MLQDQFFLKVIKHAHFNPRLIEWLSSQTRLRNVRPDEYQTHILQLLENPESIWDHAFRHQISLAARHVLISLYTLGDWTTEAIDLEPAFISLHRHAAIKYQQRIASSDFRRALQELDNAFLSYRRGHVSFLNPSIREFVAAVIADDRETCEDLLVSAVRFKQLVDLWELSQARQASELHRFLRDNMDLFVESLSRLLHGPTLRTEKMRYGSWHGYQIDMGEEARIGFLVQLAEGQKSHRVAALASNGASSLVARWNVHVAQFGAVLSILSKIRDTDWFLARGGRDVYRALLDGLLDDLPMAGADDWLQILDFPDDALEWTEAEELRLSKALKRYVSSGVDDERSDCTTLDALSDLRVSLEELEEKYSLGLARAIERIDEDIAEREDARDDDYREGGGYSGGGTATQESISDEDIAQMFDTLHEGI